MAALCLSRLALQNLVEIGLQDVVLHEAANLGPLAIFHDYHRRRLAQCVFCALRFVGDTGVVQMAVRLHQIAHLFEIRRGEHFRHRGIHVSVLRPILLLCKQRLGHDLVLADLARGVGVTGRDLRVVMLREAEIPVKQLDLAGGHVVPLHFRQHFQEELAAGGTFKVRIKLHGHLGGRRSGELIILHGGRGLRRRLCRCCFGRRVGHNLLWVGGRGLGQAGADKQQSGNY